MNKMASVLLQNNALINRVYYQILNRKKIERNRRIRGTFPDNFFLKEDCVSTRI